MRATGSDVIVVGGGVEGCSIAYQLARRGVHVTLLEAREVASGASGASAGGVRQQGRDPRELPLAMRAIAMWPALGEELGADLDYHQDGHLTLIVEEADLPLAAESVTQQRAGGLDLRLVEGDELRALAPHLSPDVLAGIWCPTDGHANPIATTRAFAAAARRLGAQILEHTPVSSLLTSESRVRGVRTAGGDLEAGVVVLAAGAWSGPLAATVGLELPQVVRAPQMLLTTPMPPALKPVLGSMGRRLSLKQRSRGHYLIGGGWPATVDLEADPPRGRVRRESVAGSARTAVSVWPVLREARLLRAWAGLEAEAADQVPMLGASGIPGLLLATGFSGHGFALAPYVGVLLAELATTGRAPLPLDDLALARFQQARPVVERSA